MESTILLVFLTFFFISVCFFAVGILVLVKKSWSNLSIFLVSLLCLVVIGSLGSMVEAEKNFFMSTLRLLWGFDRPHIVSAAMGMAFAFPLMAFWLFGKEKVFRWNNVAQYLIIHIGLIGVLMTGGLLVAKDVLSPYLPHKQRNVGEGMFVPETPTGFILEEVLNSREFVPVRVAINPQGKIFLGGHTGIAGQSGVIVELVADPQSRMLRERVVASMLNDPYGMAFFGDDLYVSRSGQHTRWEHGELQNVNTGGVTMLRDLDGDGIMDYYHDVISNLPGAQAPDYLHRNYAIAFGPDQSLYITSGISSDSHPPSHSWAGTILRAIPPDYKKVEVFAKGLRNTFGLVFGPKGDLFATDNDAQGGVLANAGDKLLHVTRGANFGHPFADHKSMGVKKSILVSPFSLGGMAYTQHQNLPEKYQNCLYIVSYGEGKILRYRLKKQDNVYMAEGHEFASVPGAVDIAAAPNGDFYVVVYPNKVMRIRYIGE